MKNLNVYIATLPRSGSTLLGMMLGQHYKIFHIGESSYWGKLNPYNVKCSCGKTGCDFLMNVYSAIKNKPEVAAIYFACSIIDRIEEPEKVYHPLSLPDNESSIINPKQINVYLEQSVIGLEVLSNIFRCLNRRPIIVDNTKTIYIAEQLLYRQGWKIILLTRDPRGIAYSNKQAGIRKNVPRSVETKISIFVNFAKKALNLLNSNVVLHIKYEDLCFNSKSALNKVCNFLDVDFTESMLNFRHDKGHTLMGNRMRFNETDIVVEDLGWIKGLSIKEIGIIEKNYEMRLLFERLGYQLF